MMPFPEKYRGEFVAWKLEPDGKVRIIEHDKNFGNLLERLIRRGIDPRFVFIEYIPKN